MVQVSTIVADGNRFQTRVPCRSPASHDGRLDFRSMVAFFGDRRNCFLPLFRRRRVVDYGDVPGGRESAAAGAAGPDPDSVLVKQIEAVIGKIQFRSISFCIAVRLPVDRAAIASDSHHVKSQRIKTIGKAIVVGVYIVAGGFGRRHRRDGAPEPDPFAMAGEVAVFDGHVIVV